MKWLNHTLIAGALCAVVSPPHVAVCVAGATAPDWMEYVAKICGRKIKHRGPTHVLTHWLIIHFHLGLPRYFYGIRLGRSQPHIN
nr:hypothetical protein [Photobacterium kishitanii]